MQANYINPFIQSAITMIKTLSNIDFARGNLSLTNGVELVNGIGGVIKIQSNYLSEVVYDFSELLAIKITESMNGTKKEDVPRAQFDIMFEDTILELCNLISGRAITLLYNEKIECNVSPPLLVRGMGNEIVESEEKAIILPLTSDYGDLNINVVLHGG